MSEIRRVDAWRLRLAEENEHIIEEMKLSVASATTEHPEVAASVARLQARIEATIAINAKLRDPHLSERELWEISSCELTGSANLIEPH